jgi:bifunctional lysine-specific demethylase and histidyl-hydroxylase MINA
MLAKDAEASLARVLAPWTVDAFLDEVLPGGFRVLRRDGRAERGQLLGADPRATLAQAVHLAPRLTWHSANALGPPPSLADVRDAADFRDCIAAFHALNYSVRFPDLRPLSPRLDEIARALEAVLHAPVTVAAFWSVAGIRAPVHYDDHDLIVIQLAGAKRWRVATRPSDLFNPWKGVDGNPPDLGAHETFDVEPGDLLYLPRGAFHTVDSTAESLHVAIGFTPLTVREALIAAIDHLSDLDRPLLAAAGRLLEAVRTPAFLAAALQRRAARTVGDLDPLPRPTAPPALSLDSELVHAQGAFCHLSANTGTLDFAFPGGHLYIHRGAQDAVVFVADTPRFRVRDLPGGLADDVRLALCARFVEVGFLEPAAELRAAAE